MGNKIQFSVRQQYVLHDSLSSGAKFECILEISIKNNNNDE